jgi:mannan endo-1,4-beta-mannosidase
VSSDCSTLAPPRFADSGSKASNADRYVEFSFVSGAPSLMTNQSEEIHLGFFVPNYANFTQTNDYSFAASSDFATSQRVTVYRNGTLIWGVEP